MKEIFTDLCIGGPKDGQRQAVKGERFEIAVLPPMSAAGFHSAAPETSVTQKVIYERGILRGEDTTFYCWRIEGLSYDSLLEKLLINYAEQTGDKDQPFCPTTDKTL